MDSQKEKGQKKQPGKFGLRKVKFAGTGVYTPPPETPVSQEKEKENGQRSED